MSIDTTLQRGARFGTFGPLLGQRAEPPDAGRSIRRGRGRRDRQADTAISTRGAHTSARHLRRTRLRRRARLPRPLPGITSPGRRATRRAGSTATRSNATAPGSRASNAGTAPAAAGASRPAAASSTTRRIVGPPRLACCFCRFYVKRLMCVYGLIGGGAGRLQEVPDAAGEVALEAADRFAGALAIAASSGDVVAGRLVTAGAGDDDAGVARR